MPRECLFLWKRKKSSIPVVRSWGHGSNRYVNFKSATACSVLPRAHRLVSKEEEREESHLARYKMRSLPHSLINWPRAPRLGPHAPFALPLPPRTPEPGAPWPPRGPFGPLPPSTPLHILFTSSASFRMPIGPFKSTSWRHRTELPTYIREERVSLFSSFLSFPPLLLSTPLHSVPCRAVPLRGSTLFSCIFSPLCSSLGLLSPTTCPPTYVRFLSFSSSLSLPLSSLLWPVFSFGRLSWSITAASLSFYLVDSFFIALPRLPFPRAGISFSLFSNALLALAARVRDLSTRRLVYSLFCFFRFITVDP